MLEVYMWRFVSFGYLFWKYMRDVMYFLLPVIPFKSIVMACVL